MVGLTMNTELLLIDHLEAWAVVETLIYCVIDNGIAKKDDMCGRCTFYCVFAAVELDHSSKSGGEFVRKSNNYIGIAVGFFYKVLHSFGGKKKKNKKTLKTSTGIQTINNQILMLAV